MTARYRTVTVRISSVLPSSVWVIARNRQAAQNIPRSLLHGGDDLKVATMPRHTAVELRVLAWKAEELGLA